MNWLLFFGCGCLGAYASHARGKVDIIGAVLLALGAMMIAMAKP